jgi:hypothetical protein
MGMNVGQTVSELRRLLGGAIDAQRQVPRPSLSAQMSGTVYPFKGDLAMDEQQATALAEAIGGETWQSGGDIWLVIIRRDDGRLVVMSDDVICEYDSEDKFEDGVAAKSIALRS